MCLKSVNSNPDPFSDKRKDGAKKNFPNTSLLGRRTAQRTGSAARVLGGGSGQVQLWLYALP